MTALARRLRSGGIILCYHNVIADRRPWGSLGLHMPLRTFERQMRWLAANYAVVSLDEFAGRSARGQSLRGAVTLTFDDGYRGVFDHAWPVLRDLGIAPTVFIVAEVPGRDQGFWWDHPEVLRAYSPARHEYWLTSLRGEGTAIVESLSTTHTPPAALPANDRLPAAWPTITAALGSGLRLGVHSATHRSLVTLDDDELQREVVASRDAITRRTGVTPEFFAYPYGLWNNRVRRAVRAAGYRAAFTLDDGPRGATIDPWALPRVNVPASIGDAAFQAWTAGLNLRSRRSA